MLLALRPAVTFLLGQWRLSDCSAMAARARAALQQTKRPCVRIHASCPILTLDGKIGEDPEGGISGFEGDTGMSLKVVKPRILQWRAQVQEPDERTGKTLVFRVVPRPTLCTSP